MIGVWCGSDRTTVGVIQMVKMIHMINMINMIDMITMIKMMHVIKKRTMTKKKEEE